jgi:23S rRNA pseudouridine2604 synthase
MTDRMPLESTQGIRLAKRVAALLKCSRSAAEQVIVGGWVQVNGVVVDEPARRVSDEKIEVHPQAQQGSIPLLTLLLHKTDGVTCWPDGKAGGQASIWEVLDPAQRCEADRSELQVSARQCKSLLSVTPIEDAATGLVVLSEDPRILRHLEDRQSPLENEMSAEVQGQVSPEVLVRLNPQGLRTSINHQTEQVTVLRLALKGYVPGELGRLFAGNGLELLSLKRLRLGRMNLAPLQPGQWRALLPYERF